MTKIEKAITYELKAKINCLRSCLINKKTVSKTMKKLLVESAILVNRL